MVDSFPALRVYRSLEVFQKALLTFYLLFLSIILGWPLASSSKFIKKEVIRLRLVVSVYIVNQRLVKDREFLKGVTVFIFEFGKVNLPVLIQENFSSAFLLFTGSGSRDRNAVRVFTVRK